MDEKWRRRVIAATLIKTALYVIPGAVFFLGREWDVMTLFFIGGPGLILSLLAGADILQTFGLNDEEWSYSFGCVWVVIAAGALLLTAYSAFTRIFNPWLGVMAFLYCLGQTATSITGSLLRRADPEMQTNTP